MPPRQAVLLHGFLQLNQRKFNRICFHVVLLLPDCITKKFVVQNFFTVLYWRLNQLLESEVKDIPTLGWPNAPQGWHARTGGYAKDMFLRDYFAAKAMEALILRGFEDVVLEGEDWQKLISHGAFSIADTMLEVRGQ